MELRGSPHADTEIRLLAVEVCRPPQAGKPQHLPRRRNRREPDGMPAVRVQHSKV